MVQGEIVDRKRCLEGGEDEQDAPPAAKQARGTIEQGDPAASARNGSPSVASTAQALPDMQLSGAAAASMSKSLSLTPSADEKSAQLYAACQSAVPNDSAAIKLEVAYSEDKGSRTVMEDVAVINLDGRAEAQQQAGIHIRCSFMAIFDGHGGREVAQLAAQQLHTQVLTAGLQQVLAAVATNASDGVAGPSIGASADGKLDVKAAKSAITQGFQTTDTCVLQRCKADNWQDGACAVCCWAVQNTLLVANIGDAKAVLARTTDKDVGRVKAGSLRALVLSKDHLAIVERARIVKAGGYVSTDGRLNGRLQVSRSFGDAQLKQGGCICTPDIAAFGLTSRDSFLLMACDGFWSVFEPQGAIDMAATLLAEGRDAKAVTNRLLNEAVRERKCKDNCTVMLIRFARREDRM